jgi:nucleoside-diphosphate-sugar epimerase
MAVLIVTGGATFVMCYLARHWVERDPGNVAVVIDRDPLDAAAENWFAPLSDRVRFAQGDVARTACWYRLSARVADLGAVTHLAMVPPSPR